jgi:hypothetical protein
MTRRRVAVIAAVLLLPAGCSNVDNGRLPAQAPPATTVPGVTERQIDKALTDAGIVGRPDQATAAAYLADLKKIDPAIVAGQQPDQLIDRGRAQCTSIQQWPHNHGKLVKLVNARFTAPKHPHGFGDAKAGKILKVIHKRICPGL